MSYGQGHRAFMAWKMEQRKRKLRQLYYDMLDDIGLLLWSMVVVIAVACTIFLWGHR